jgi:HSP20 family protein
MRPRVPAIALASEIDDFADEIRDFFDLGRAFGSESLAGECSPAVDVYETDDAVEVVADLPGVGAASVRVLAKGESLLIAGDKSPRRVRGESTFHLVERGYGRFARVVRLDRPCDASHARVTLAHGELRISLPKIAERRGRPIPVAIT